MWNRIVTAGLVGVLVVAGLAMAEARVSSVTDLDAFTDAQLRRDLVAELDDIEFDADEQHSLPELREAILEALSDEDDDDGDDANEAEIDFSDLEAEMEEAETTVEAVVDMALERADELVQRDDRPALLLVADNSAHSWSYQTRIIPVVQSRNVRRGFTTSRVAMQQTTNAIIAGVRRKR